MLPRIADTVMEIVEMNDTRMLGSEFLAAINAPKKLSIKFATRKIINPEIAEAIGFLKGVELEDLGKYWLT